MTNYNAVIQDKDPKVVIKGWNSNIEKAKDKLELDSLDKPAGSPNLSTQPDMRRLSNEDRQGVRRVFRKNMLY